MEIVCVKVDDWEDKYIKHALIKKHIDTSSYVDVINLAPCITSPYPRSPLLNFNITHTGAYTFNYHVQGK